MVQVDQKIIEAKKRAEAALLKLPGVTGVDIGYKEVGGKPTDQIAIRVLVEEKKDVPKAQQVPKEIEGIPTDVIQRRFELHQMAAKMRVADLQPMVDAGTYTPLKGGISIGPCRAIGGFVFAGTLGCLVKDNGTGQHMMLSNFHVMCVDNTHAVGDQMTQPSRVDGGACPGGVVGTLQRQSLGGQVDCAVADITGTRGDSCEIVDIGYVAGQTTASLGQKVRKRGRTTLLTYGEVDSIHLTVTVDYGDGIGNVTLTDQIGIKPDPAHNPKFGDHGDSGSVVVDDARKVLGLYFAGDDTGYGVANPIAAVLSALNVSLCTGGIKLKDFKDHKHEIKEFKIEKFELKDHKIEKIEHKELKIELKEKLELKEIAKLESPEKTIPEKGGKELKEGGYEGGPGFPGGPGDPGPIDVPIGGGIFGQAGAKPVLADNKAYKFEKPELKEHVKIEKREDKPESKSELKDHKHEKFEIKEHKEFKLEKIEHKEISKLEHPEKTGFKEKDGKELKEAGYEGPGFPGGPGDPGPIFGQAAQAGDKLAEAKPNKEFKDFKVEKVETKELPVEKTPTKEFKTEGKDGKEIKFEKNEIKELKPEKAEKNELKELKGEKPEYKEHKNEHKEFKHEKLERKEIIKEISKLEHGEKTAFKEKDGKEIKEGGLEGPGGPGGPGDPGPILGQRVAALEAAIASLGHFISASQRPDLSRGALSSEPDLAGQSQALAAQAKAAKDAKDAKDAEKLGDR